MLLRLHSPRSMLLLLLLMISSIQTTSSACSGVTHHVQPSRTSSTDLHVRWIDVNDLEARQSAWDFLSQHAMQPNPAFESNYLIPALRHLASDTVQVIVVEDHSAPLKESIVGIVPIETKRIYRLPFKAAEVWRHDQCFNATPLLAKNCAAEAWSLIRDFLVSDGYSLLSLDTVSAEPEVDAVLQNLEQQSGVSRFQRDRFSRAGFTPGETADVYILQHASKGARKKLRANLGKLGRVGDVTWERSSDESDYEQLAEEFMQLEKSGWKGEAGTALACSDSTKSFYRDLIHRSAEQGKARFLILKLDGQSIAMISDIQSGETVYCYKTAFNDTYARYSPGFQVEFKNIEYLHREGIQRGDSCTAPGSSTLSRIWGQTLAYQNVVFSLKPGLAQTAVRLLPKIQSVLKRLRNFKSGKSTGTQA